MSKITARYPADYPKILNMLQADGTPLELKLSSNEIAVKERLQFYNYLRWCRRNPKYSAHLYPRYDQVVIQVRGPIISFHLQTEAISSLSAALDDAISSLETMPRIAADEPLPLPGAPRVSDSDIDFSFIEEELTKDALEAPKPFDYSPEAIDALRKGQKND